MREHLIKMDSIKKISDWRFAAQFRMCYLALLVLLFVSFGVHAQVPPEDNAAPQTRGNEMRARGLLRILNLTPDQQAEIRRISAQSAGERRELQRRWQLARRALDEAIYSVTADEAIIELRAGEAAGVQAAIVRMRALTEYRIRRVLTPEQLQILRDLRARFPNRPNRMRSERRLRRAPSPRMMPETN